MHIFLTGPHDIGKTTIINEVLCDLPDYLEIGGFRTFKGKDFAPGKNHVLMVSAEYGNNIGKSFKVAMRDKARSGFESYPEKFNTEGVAILRNSVKKDLIIMDELGFMESDAREFQNAVMELLSGDIPVLGVIKPNANHFLDKVREHPKVRIIEVTNQNRDGLHNTVITHLEVYLI